MIHFAIALIFPPSRPVTLRVIYSFPRGQSNLVRIRACSTIAIDFDSFVRWLYTEVSTRPEWVIIRFMIWHVSFPSAIPSAIPSSISRIWAVWRRCLRWAPRRLNLLIAYARPEAS